jgi:hypothetical protein
MRSKLLTRAALPFTLLLGVLLQASSPYPGGCGSDVRRSHKYVRPPCQADGVTPPGCEHPAEPTEGGRGTHASVCPEKAPLDCGTGVCCPESFPYCCGNASWCGLNMAACDTLAWGESRDDEDDEDE